MAILQICTLQINFNSSVGYNDGNSFGIINRQWDTLILYNQGPVQSEVLILYVLLMVTKTLTTSDKEKLATTNSYQYTKVTTTILRKNLNEEKLYQIATLQRIWTNIRTARFRIKKQSNTIRSFYNKVLTVVNVYEWLPKEHLELFENKIRHLDKHIKVSTMIPILHTSLEIFLSTFEEMQTYNADEQHIVQVSAYKIRHQILEQIICDIRSAVDEVKSGMEAFDLEENNATTTSTRNWTTTSDHTFIMVQDWNVIRNYYKFIKEWEKITKAIFENYCNTVTIEHNCHISIKTSDQSVT